MIYIIACKITIKIWFEPLSEHFFLLLGGNISTKIRNFALQVNKLKMKHINALLFSTLMTVMVFLSGCKDRPRTSAEPAAPDSDKVAEPVAGVRDTTLYGEAGDFGMSTFCLITDEGDTVSVTRDSESGEEGVIYGDAQPGDRFGLLTREHGEALLSAINLTQLERFTKDFKLLNGRVILSSGSHPDTVSIVSLDNDSLIVNGKEGVRKYTPKK